MEDESRLELNNEIYGVIKEDEITFHHEDTTTFPSTVCVSLELLVPGLLFDYEIVSEDITWIMSMKGTMALA